MRTLPAAGLLGLDVINVSAQPADDLRASGVRLVYFESPGTAHEWQSWRRDLFDVAPRLFH